MTAIAAQNLEKNAARRTKSAGRRATDKYWSLLPILLLVIWIAASQDVFGKLLYHSHASDGKFESHVSEAKESYESNEKFDSQVSEETDSFKSNDEFDSIVNKKEDLWNSKNIENDWLCFDDNNCIGGYRFIRNKRNSDDAQGISYEIGSQNWILDMIACNVGFVNDNYQKNGSIVIWGNVLFCLCLIAYAMVSLSANTKYRAMIPIFGWYFILTALTRLMLFYFKNFDVTVMYWLFPELIVILLAAILTYLTGTHDEGNEKNNEKTGILTVMSLIGSAPIIIILPLILYMKVLYVFSYYVLQLKLGNYLSAGIICYGLLIYQYFVFMAISCAINHRKDHNRSFLGVLDFLRASFIVGRYHFGTVCYHATIIVPKIKAILIMNEEEFKVIPIFSTIDRLYMMHWKVHDLSLSMTAARGYDYSESVRESLRLSTRDSPKPIKNCYPSYSQFFRCGGILSMSINNLVIIGLWAFGVMLDSSTVVENFSIYLVVTLSLCITGKLFDVCLDTDLIYTDEKENVDKMQVV